MRVFAANAESVNKFNYKLFIGATNVLSTVIKRVHGSEQQLLDRGVRGPNTSTGPTDRAHYSCISRPFVILSLCSVRVHKRRDSANRRRRHGNDVKTNVLYTRVYARVAAQDLPQIVCDKSSGIAIAQSFVRNCNNGGSGGGGVDGK